MKKLLTVLCLFFLCTLSFAYEKHLCDEPHAFEECWSYVVCGYEKEVLPQSLNIITDLCFFSADINCYGEISSIPNPNHFKNFKGKKHLVITCEGRSLSHFVLDPQYGVSKKIIKEIKKAAADFDGVQIDFETIPIREQKNFKSFLTQLKKSLGKNKMLSVCVPARNKTLDEDIFDYAELSKIADRLFIMAYDQHWSTSRAGPVAAFDWGERIANYAKEIIPQEKLIMGLPFYGRSWTDKNLAKAWYFSGVERTLKENKVTKVTRTSDTKVLQYSYKTDVEVTAYFDDAQSLYEKIKLYDSAGITKIGFWRLGQEDPDIWKTIKQR